MLETLKNYLRNEEYYIILYSNYLYIYNYQEIVLFSNSIIKIKIKDFILEVNGNNLLITKMEKKELLIKGSILKLENKYE